jgi:quercetin dioxygenase-like cupin family protein
MRDRIAFVIIVLLLTLGLAPSIAAADPPANTIRHQFRADGLPVAGPTEIIKFVLDFAPGATSPLHTHPGLVLITVLEGAITLSHEGTETVHGVGESFIEIPNEEGVARNDTAGRTLAMGSVVAPQGAAYATPVPGGPPPVPGLTTRYLTRFDAAIPSGAYEVAHTVLDFAPGAQTPLQTHPGQVFVMVLEGAITSRTGGTEKMYGVGEGFAEQPGVVGQAVNASSAKATVLVTYLLPKGAALATLVPAPASPAASAPSAPRAGGGAAAAFIRRLGDG